MDRIDAMRAFVRVTELGSFAAVAAQHGVARSVVTRQIGGLERRLGAKLLARSTRRLALTSAGTAYLVKARAILALVEAAEAGAAEERADVSGPIRLSLPLSFGVERLAPPLLEFAQAHPEVALEMDYTDRRVNLIEEGFDLSIRLTAHLAATDVVRRLGRCRMMTVAAPAYLARRGRPAKPAELAHHACLAYGNGPNRNAWQYTVSGHVQSFPVGSVLLANNGEVLADAAARGLGIALLPAFIVERRVREGLLEEILTRCAPPELGVYAVLPGSRFLPHRVRVLLDFLAARLREPESPRGRRRARPQGGGTAGHAV